MNMWLKKFIIRSPLEEKSAELRAQSEVHYKQAHRGNKQ
jgi:hypothetical protein